MNYLAVLDTSEATIVLPDKEKVVTDSRSGRRDAAGVNNADVQS